MRGLASIALLLTAATASAHEDFDAAWLQPLDPILIRGPILPLGFTHGMGSWADFVLEMTPYWSKSSPCVNGCRDQVIGMIATAGVALGRPIVSAPDVELDWFAGPKAIVAVASETGVPGDLNGGDLPFNPGTASEVGAGVDLGLQVHGRRFGWFAALVIGLQYTKAYNYSVCAEAYPCPPTWPYLLMRASTSFTRVDDWSPLLVPNMNLLRMGFVF